MNSEKIIGYLLLTVGVGIIIVSTFSLYQVFSGQQKPPQVVQFEVPTISLPAQQSFQIDLPEGMELPEGITLPGLEKQPAEGQEFKLLPDEAVNSLINMFIYLMLMGFIASSGVKIASIGIKMIKDIKVEIKEEKIRQAAQ